MANNLNVVANRVVNVGSVVAGVVVANAGSAVVLAASGNSGGMEVVDSLAV